MEALPPKTLVVLVMKLHADRVARHLLGKDACLDLHDQSKNETTSCRQRPVRANDAAGHPNGAETTEQQQQHVQIDDDDDDENVELLDDAAMTGVSRARRGYFLLLVKNAKRSVSAMSPMGRQNISFVGRLTHCYANIEPDTNIEASKDTAAAASAAPTYPFVMIWDQMLAAGFDMAHHLLRIECYPRNQMDHVCLQLDCAAAAAGAAKVEVEKTPAIEVPLTASRSKCTHRLTVIVLATKVYFGLENQQEHADTIQAVLNDNANAEIMTTPCNDETGADVAENLDPSTPLSRAYYKLQEIWTDYLQAHGELLQLQAGSTGLDIGASPGGWTQVMVHSMLLSEVVALDPARLAQRITKLPQVTHVANKLDDESVDWKKLGPFRIVVCDASVLWHALLDGLLQNFKRMQLAWSLPVTFVVTMKLPFKTLQSIQRQVRQIHERVPTFVDELSTILFPTRRVHCSHRLAHLMANSDSERTLIVVLTEQE